MVPLGYLVLLILVLILFGSSDPSADLGAIGDLYLNTDTYDIYAKTESGEIVID